MSTLPWDNMIKELCSSKAEELQLVGYEHVSPEEVWACVSAPYVKKGMPELHQLVNDILSLKPTKFMNFLMINAYKQDPFE